MSRMLYFCASYRARLSDTNCRRRAWGWRGGFSGGVLKKKMPRRPGEHEQDQGEQTGAGVSKRPHLFRQSVAGGFADERPHLKHDEVKNPEQPSRTPEGHRPFNEE